MYSERFWEWRKEGPSIFCISARSNHPFYHSSQQSLYGIILPRFTDSGQAEWLQRCISFQTNTGIQSGQHVPVINYIYCFISNILAFFPLQDIQFSVNSLLRDQKATHDSSLLSVFGESEEKTRNGSDQIQIYPSSPVFTVSPSVCDCFTTFINKAYVACATNAFHS